LNRYRVAPSNNFEKNSNFHTAENIFIDINTEELNDVLSSSKHAQVIEDDSDEINVENYDGDEDESIDEKEDNYD
jgi:hypothetical protein